MYALNIDLQPTVIKLSDGSPPSGPLGGGPISTNDEGARCVPSKSWKNG